MGHSHSVYMADASGQDIYVMAALTREWAILDFVADAALLVAGVEGIVEAAVADAAGLPGAIKSFSDLFDYLKVAVQIISSADRAESGASSAAQALVNAYQNTSIPIANNDYKDVQKEGVLSIYLSPSGIAGLLGAKTVSVMVLSGDGKQLAMWDTGDDDSWIATDQQTIVRSVYGSIFKQDPGSGSEDWSDMISS